VVRQAQPSSGVTLCFLVHGDVVNHSRVRTEVLLDHCSKPCSSVVNSFEDTDFRWISKSCKPRLGFRIYL